MSNEFIIKGILNSIELYDLTNYPNTFYQPNTYNMHTKKKDYMTMIQNESEN